MSLIEQLGGYEECKRLRAVPAASSFSIRGIKFTCDELEQALLQYRREHNIFEVRDYVFLRDSHFTELWIVTNILKDGSIEIKTAVHGYPVPSKCWGMYYGKSNGLIHATNEEIQAGRRLEVCGG